MGFFICQKKAVGILVLFLIISVILCPMRVDAADSQNDSRIPIRITVGEQDFSAELYDNETTRAWVEQMPMTLSMNELNGNEKYHYFSESLPTNPERPDAIHTGDLMLYGQSCLVLFYKDFVTPYSYTPLGYMEDAAGLAEALGDGNITVSFRLDDGELTGGKDEPTEQPEQKPSEQPSESTTEQPPELTTEQSPESTTEQLPKSEAEQPKQKQVKVQSIKLTGNVVKLAKGKKVKLNAVISPTDASDKGLKWTSSDEKVAVVTADGIVTGKKKGTATITAAAVDGSGIKGRYKITVMPHAVKKIALKSKTKSITVGKRVKVVATVFTTGKMANKKLVWSTSNEKYATVNANGKVTAKKAGKGKTVLITAKATDGSGKKASIKFKIKLTNGQGADSVMNIQVGEKVFTAKLADNSSAKALAEKLAKSPVTISMRDYGGFEKVGDFGFDLVTNDKQITTEPGDMVLYEGDQLVIFYGKNSWSYTRLGKIQNVTAEELKAALGNGNVKVTLSLP